MNHSLQLTKKDQESLILKMAEMLVKKIEIDPTELVVIPTAAISQYTGLSPKSVPRKLPITEISPQKRGVILKTYLEYLKNNTRPPGA